jgi:ATP-dependent DNA ligase
VRLYSRNAYDWTVRLAAIAAAAELIKAKSFTIEPRPATPAASDTR